MILSHVTKKYGQTTALNDVCFEIAEGEITAVLGESGAGKTTLLNAVAGFIPYEGTIDGTEGGKPRRREGCSYLFQQAKLLPNLTAEENLRFVLPKSEWNRIDDMLARVGLQGKGKAYPHELSGGEKQRVAVARAFLFPHRLLLMDEPFAALDLSLKKSMIGLVLELQAESGSTVAFVTHDVHEAAVLARHAVVLRKGRVIEEIAIDEPYPRDFFRASPAEEKLVRALVGCDG